MGRGERNHMKKENNFLDLMGEIDEKFVYEASLPWKKRNVNLKLKLAKIAAAGVVIALLIGGLGHPHEIKAAWEQITSWIQTALGVNENVELYIDSVGKTITKKGSFVAADERKTIEFVDVTVKSEPHENKAEELVLFLERYYQSGLSEQEIRKAVNLTAMLVKEKAEKLGARLVLSSSYKNVLENKNYVLTNFYMYISASKNGSQYLDSLGGAAGVSASGSYTCNTFLLEAEERREESL